MRALTLALLLPLAACSANVDSAADARGVAGSGTGDARSFAIADFSGVELRGSDNVDVRVGSAFSVRAEGPAKQLDRLLIEKVGDTLRIGRKSGVTFSWNGGDHDAVRIFVTMPRIAAAQISGSGDLALDAVEGSRFTAANSGSGDMTIGTLSVETADLSVAGSGGIAAAGGTARQLALSVDGSGDIQAKHLKAASAHVSVAGSGTVSADVAGDADVSLAGSGDVDLGRAARCTISKTGSGEVSCGG